MAEINLISPVAGESQDLALHTELCAQRYNQLIAKFDEVDTRLHKIENMITDIHSKVNGLDTQRLKTYLTWAGIAITSLMSFAAGLVVYIITK